MSLMVVTWLLGALFLFTLVVTSVLFRQNKKLQTKLVNIDNNIQANDILVAQLQGALTDLSAATEQQKLIINEQQNEAIQVSKQLEYRIKTLQKELTQQQEVFSQFQNQQPEDKLYSRAFKLAELGADIEEIMRECDIPKAEADMLMSVHQQRIRHIKP